MKSQRWAPPKNLWVDESKRWAPLWVDADSKKCQICVVQMAKNLVHSFYLILYQPKGHSALSRFGHYFCSNLYGCAPRGPRGVKKSDFFLQIKLLSSCVKIAPKSHKLQKIVKIEKKKCQKTLFS